MLGLVRHGHPVLVSLVWLLGLHASTATPAWALPRPMVVVVLAALLIHGLALVLVRRVAAASVMASAVITLLVGAWPATVAICTLLAWLAAVDFQRARHGEAGVADRLLARASAGATIVSALLLSVIVGQSAVTGAYWSSAGPSADAAAGDDEGMPAGPDIYVVILDGYPGAKALASRFGVDIGPFTAALEERGFVVPSSARSNYSTTWLSLAALFRMDYVHILPEMAGVSARGSEQYRVASRLMNDAPVLADLRERGYRIVASQSPYSDIALTNADVVLPVVGPTWFEEVALEESTLAAISGDLGRELIADVQRREVEATLDRVVETARRPDQAPVFMFAHALSPHPPFLFAADGSPRPLPDCFPRSCTLWDGNLDVLGLARDGYAALMADQLAYLNGRLLATVDGVLSARPDAVIVLISDHATRYDKDGDPEEAVSNFLAARMPGHPDAFPDDAHLVNTLPTVLNAYLETDYPTRDFRAWISHLTILDLTPLESAR